MNRVRRRRTEQGYSLIELMMVIMIMGILSSTATVGTTQVFGKVRDTVRKQTLSNLRLALEQYYTDHGSYPSSKIGGQNHLLVSEPGWTGNGCNTCTDNGGDWIPGLVPAYMRTLPHDPGSAGLTKNTICKQLGIKPTYIYMSFADASGPYGGYKLWSVCPEQETLSPTDRYADGTWPEFAWSVCSGKSCIAPPP